MFEESAESFTSRWRSEASEVRIFPRVENDPLLELEAAGVILHALERTGPYLSAPGRGRVIVHALTERVEPAADTRPAVEVTGISRARFQGVVTRREENLLVVDAGFRLVVGVLEAPSHDVTVGSHVRFEALPPLHAFVLTDHKLSQHDHEV